MARSFLSALRSARVLGASVVCAGATPVQQQMAVKAMMDERSFISVYGNPRLLPFNLWLVTRLSPGSGFADSF